MNTEEFGYLKSCLQKAEEFYLAKDVFMYGVMMNEIIKRLYILKQIVNKENTEKTD